MITKALHNSIAQCSDVSATTTTQKPMVGIDWLQNKETTERIQRRQHNQYILEKQTKTKVTKMTKERTVHDKSTV